MKPSILVLIEAESGPLRKKSVKNLIMFFTTLKHQCIIYLFVIKPVYLRILSVTFFFLIPLLFWIAIYFLNFGTN